MFLILIGAILLASSHAGGVGCGRQAAAFQPTLPKDRIINGQYSQPHSWPWMISQHWNKKSYCGGTLLRVRDDVEASDIVLTAAHCVGKTENPDNYKNWVAIANLHWQSYMQDIVVRDIVKAKHPSNYVTFTKNDIALLKLDKPINFTDTIRPICLPKQNESVPVGKLCMSAGWGRIHTNDKEGADALQQLETPVHDSNKCTQLWGSGFAGDVAMCAGPLNGSAATCSGDSGGVLACRADDGRWVQYGVVSYGVAEVCAMTGKPPVFARVSTFVDWIQATIKEMTSI